MRNKSIFGSKLAILGILSFQLLSAEIEQVGLYWKQGVCKDNCAMLLHKRLLETKGVARVSLNADGGEASLNWVPGEPFSYRDVKRPMQRVGLGLEEIWVKVRGSIQKTSKGLKLVSFGDNTTFTLISPMPEGERQGQKRKSLGLRRLDDFTKEKLLIGTQGDQLVTVEGPLLSPHRAPPYYLIIENFKFEDRPVKSFE